MANYEQIEEVLLKYNAENDRIYKRTGTKFREMFRKDDLAFWLKTSNMADGRIEKGFFIIFKMSKSKDNSWSFWCPSENQINVLNDKILSLYKEFEKLNGR